MSTEHEGLRAWSLARRAKLLKYHKIDTLVRANERRANLYYLLGPEQWTLLFRQHRTRV
jgi:hypothetical protein